MQKAVSDSNASRPSRRAWWSLLAFATIACPMPGSGLAAQSVVEVFAPGAVTKAESNVYQGQFSADGSEFWFFRKMQPDGEDYRIYRSRRQAGGEWSEPERMVLGGADFSDLYPAPSPDGRFLVFTSYRPYPGDTTSHANANLWYAEREGAGWGRPQPMRGASTPENYDSGPWFDRQGTLHFTSTSPDWSTRWHREVRPGGSLAATPWQEDPSTHPWQNWRSDLYVWDVTPSPDGRLMILGVSALDPSGRRGPPDLWMSMRTGSEWSDPVRLSPEINTAMTENFVVFTPDGRDMLFVRDFASYHRVSVASLSEHAHR